MKRWVVKIGSQMVCQGGPVLVRALMKQVRLLKRKYGIEVIWVTSGAIASAVERTDFKKNKSNWSLSEKQALSAIGQPLLMDMYNLSLNANGMLGAQVLLTASDMGDKGRLKNFQKTIEQLLKWGVVPLINENDVVATDEIKFGDNDSLSALVASSLKADRLVILTDVEGLFDRDPKKFKSAKIISRLDRVTPKLLKPLSSLKTSTHGTGGIFSKLKASKLASLAGINTNLVKGDSPQVLLAIAEGALVGTFVRANR
jgi:glutamate 5-kinase